MVLRDHPAIVGKLSVYQLRYEHYVAKLELRLGRGQFDRDRIIAVLKELGELDNRLAGKYHFLLGEILSYDFSACVGQAVPVGRHQLQLPFLDDHEQAIEIVADILLGHCILNKPQKRLQQLLRDREARRGSLDQRQSRKILCRQRLQVETTFSRFHLKPLVLQRKGDLRAVRKSAQDVDELSRPHGDFLGVAGSL